MTTFASITDQLAQQAIEVPSWAYGNSGTRFRVFGTPGTPRTVFEKLADANPDIIGGKLPPASFYLAAPK